MNILILAGIGFVLLIILTLAIYYITRKLAMRALYGGAYSPSEPKPPIPAEPLYETPMPKKPLVSEDVEPAQTSNPLLEFIEKWEEPKPVKTPEIKRKKSQKTKKKDRSEEKPTKKVKVKKEQGPNETTLKTEENPLLKFIEEWEEPLPERSVKKKKKRSKD